ncbi:FecR family protein [Bacteroides sp. 519]|uniref:FecR family protein n=1 Tax=Bacteroides sp. 519 TaxID=2302937 RepID=UPI0013D74FF4|nr:FecR family protein [Bacteroides sp. 519]NDV59739.1 FecR family protein [Bacteroides sp. 519]
MKTEDIKITPKWSKSKDEIWNEAFSGLEETAPRIRHFSFWKYIAAATITLVVVGSSFAYFYKTTEVAKRGSHLAVTLPDGSKVALNADSKLSYKPYWWFVSRKVELNGEAFFEVKRGSKFTVEALQNEIRVLGTSFNVFARLEKYSVTCLTGKVEVRTDKGKNILTSNMQLNLRNGILEVSNNIDALPFVSWKENKFSFIGVPLVDVMKEIERQYNIHISTTSNLDYLYTGNFSKNKKPEEVLEIIGKALGITLNIEQ